MEIGQKLKEKRTALGLSQEQLAEQLGITRQTIANWEKGKTYPDIASILKLSDLYGLSVDELLRDDGALRKRIEQRRENIKRYCSWTHDLGMLLMVVAITLIFFDKPTGAIILAALGFFIFCIPHVVYVRRFGLSWKLGALRVLSMGMWLAGILLRRHYGDQLTNGGMLVYGGLLLLCYVNHQTRNFAPLSKGRMTAFSGFVIAAVLVAAFLPMASESVEKGDFNEAIPFDSREYRVSEVRHGNEEKLPLVKLWRGNSVYMTFPGEEEQRLEGTFTYVTQPENSPHKGIWELIPETDTQKQYRVTVEADATVVPAGLDRGDLLWDYGLQYQPLMGVQIMDSLGLVTGAASWYYDDFLSTGEEVGGLPLRGKGELRLSIPGSPDSIAIFEEYHRDGEVTYREFTLERNRKDRYTMKLEADKEAEKEFYILHIPYEDGEFVLKLGMTP